ncbi:hypothetical protein MES5069_190075 [Mesorhizobium escarrei]|uniref:Uncharacterized protein n=1 Tax=Mesorhizobium escarrei TaxID=666018 RepID=A0ABN8JK91_9HYPH|nr:hypothetical protein MES5069_190075 [Mesorhizobium escarrei]
MSCVAGNSCPSRHLPFFAQDGNASPQVMRRHRRHAREMPSYQPWRTSLVEAASQMDVHGR